MKINTLSYNISWASQKNVSAGSEKDFVDRCKKTYKKGGIQCFNNALKLINKVGDFDLIGLQEVNSDVESRIIKKQKHLKSFERGVIGLSIVSLIWNPLKLGKKIESLVFNVSTAKDDRPCLVLLTQTNDDIFLLINIHYPWRNEKTQKYINEISTVLNNKIMKSNKTKIKLAFKDPKTKIILMGDFNDFKGNINVNNPIKIKSKKKNKTIKLSHNINRSQLKKNVRTCCWHEKSHEYGHFIGPGDYILSNMKNNMFIPKILKSDKRSLNLYSDHKPIINIITT